MSKEPVEKKFPSITTSFICKRCSGVKFIGDTYHALGTYWVDVTCIKCADSVDIEVDVLEKFIKKLKIAKLRGKIGRENDVDRQVDNQ